VAFVWELTKETIDLPLACLQGGLFVGVQGLRLGGYGDGGTPALSSLLSLQVLEGP